MKSLPPVGMECGPDERVCDLISRLRGVIRLNTTSTNRSLIPGASLTKKGRAEPLPRLSTLVDLGVAERDTLVYVAAGDEVALNRTRRLLALQTAGR